jgi:hypothetical protein
VSKPSRCRIEIEFINLAILGEHEDVVTMIEPPSRTVELGGEPPYVPGDGGETFDEHDVRYSRPRDDSG